MTYRTNSHIPLFACGLLIAAGSVSAQTAWVSDQFEITLRTGPSTSNAIQRMIPSGAALEVLERDDESGYARVRTQGGTEGWVLSRYLMNEPGAREQLEALSGQLTGANAEAESLGTQLTGIRAEYDGLTNRVSELERDKEALETELEQIKRTSANVLAIDNQNKDLRQQLTNAEIHISTLEQENDDLSRESTRNWFITGALVVVGGVLIGLILPRMRFQRRSRYDSF